MFYQFGDYQLDLNIQKLYRGKTLITDDDKTLKALIILCDSYPELVEKDKLIEELWPNQVVTDWSLSKLISDIRQLLGDSGKDQEHIKTIRGRGFRLNIPVQKVDAITPQESNKVNRFSFSHIVMTIAVLGLIILGVLYFPKRSTDNESQNHYRVAVLPITSDNALKTDDWVKYGLMSMASEQLEQYTSIQTIPVSNIINVYKDTPYPSESALFDSICSQLGCSHVIVIKYRLENQTPVLGYKIISENFNSTVSEFVNKDIISTTDMLLDHLAAELIPTETDRISLDKTFSNDNKTNRSYAIGVHELYSGDLRSARNYLELALERSPDFFWAKAYLAEVDYRSGNLAVVSESIQNMSQLGLSPEQSYFLEHLYSNVLYSQGKLEDSLAVTKKLTNNSYAMKDPLLMGNELLNIGSSLQALGKTEEAIEYLEKSRHQYSTAGFGSGEGRVLFNLANVYLVSSQREQAINYYQQAREIFIKFGLTGYALMAKHQIATTNIYLGKIQNAEGELRLLINSYKEIGDKEGELTAYLDLANASFAKRDFNETTSRIEILLKELDGSEFHSLINQSLTLSVRCYLELGMLERAEANFNLIEGSWTDIRPAFALIAAHIEHDKGNLENAVNVAHKIKSDLASQWTDAHQHILDQIERSLGNNKVTPLNY